MSFPDFFKKIIMQYLPLILVQKTEKSSYFHGVLVFITKHFVTLGTLHNISVFTCYFKLYLLNIFLPKKKNGGMFREIKSIIIMFYSL